jgi:hypothetical protein
MALAMSAFPDFPGYGRLQPLGGAESGKENRKPKGKSGLISL